MCVIACVASMVQSVITWIQPGITTDSIDLVHRISTKPIPEQNDGLDI